MRMIKHPYLYNKVKFGMLHVKFKSDLDKERSINKVLNLG